MNYLRRFNEQIGGGKTYLTPVEVLASVTEPDEGRAFVNPPYEEYNKTVRKS